MMLEELISRIMLGATIGVITGTVLVLLTYLYGMIQYKRGKRDTGSHYESMQEHRQMMKRIRKLKEKIDNA